jgi:hypothetical protein
MVQHWIETNFGVTYHQQHIPRLLHRLGFSVQPPTAAASWSSRTKPASGSTAPCIRRGRRSATEGVWKTTRKMATHNRFYATVLQRDAALRQTFDQFRLTPELIDHQVARFRRAS